jgi:hypothetical protein
LAERSENEFYMMDIEEYFLALPVLGPIKSKASAKTAAAS